MPELLYCVYEPEASIWKTTNCPGCQTDFSLIHDLDYYILCFPHPMRFSNKNKTLETFKICHAVSRFMSCGLQIYVMRFPNLCHAVSCLNVLRVMRFTNSRNFITKKLKISFTSLITAIQHIISITYKQKLNSRN